MSEGGVEKSGKVKSQRKCRVNQVKSRRKPFLTVGKHGKKSKIMVKYKWYTVARFTKCKAGNGKS